jgi:hypothetical protein
MAPQHLNVGDTLINLKRSSPKGTIHWR